MIKKPQRRLLTAILLVVLLSSSAYAIMTPTAKAAEMTTKQKGFSVLSDVVGLDLTKYNVKTEENSQFLPFLGNVLQENIVYSLTSANSKFRAGYTFANGNLQGIYVFENEGTPILTKPLVNSNAVLSAQEFLNSYQAYTAKPIFGELKSTLNDVDASKNLTKTVGDKVLEVNAYEDNTHFKWYYTANGAIAPYTKVISMGFKDGFLTSFIDNWDLYNIGSTSVNLSKEEAMAIALDTARNHSWTMQLDDNALDPSNFNQNRSVSWIALTFEGSLDANKTRSENVLELYPVWRIGLVLNKVYGELYGLEVDIWADTKEVRSVKEEYSPIVAELFENNTADTDMSTAFVNGNFMIVALLSGTVISVVGAVVTKQFKKKPSALYQLKPRFLKTCGILLGFLILSVVFLPLVESANASNAGIIWGSRSSGAPNSPISYSWRKQDWEISRQWEVTGYIGSNCFIPANGYSGFSNEGVNKDVILYQAGYLRDNYDYMAVVDWDHGVGGYPGRAPGYPTVGYNEEHYMFEDDWGTVVGTRDNFQSDWSHGVYDIDIYNVVPPAKVHFAFIDACHSANIYRLGQGFTGSGNPLGMPFAFTHRLVSYTPTGYSGTLMSDDGYSRPDAFPQCYIGFPSGSAALGQNIPYNPPGPQWYQWIVFFFYYSLNFDVSVKDALNWASNMQWQCGSFSNSPLRGSGFQAVWPMYRYNQQTQQWEWMSDPQSYCTLAVYGNSNIRLKNFQPSHMVTWPSVSGPTSGDISTPYEFSAYSIDSHGHNIQYRFDWGDGSPYTETGWYSNGATAYASHTWTSQGIYNVRVQARCPSSGWSSWSTPRTIAIGNYHWLTVDAYDNYWNQLNVNVWVDDVWVGTSPISILVAEGWHRVEVDYDLGYWYFVEFSDGYGNGESRPIYSDTWLTAYYQAIW